MSLRVLVIEDNAMNLALMTYVLQAHGHVVVTAGDGAEGLARLRSDKPDLVLCDIQMPVMDGYAFAQAVRADASIAAAPLVAVTASAMPGDRERMLAAGFDGYLSKPIEPATLMRDLAPFVRHSPEAASHAQAHRTRALAAEAPSSPQLRPHVPGSVRHAILVVDDEPLNLRLTRSLLEPAGYQVMTAESPFQAYAEACAHRPDLVISDVGMHPHEGGFDLIRMLRNDPALADVPLMFITATHRDPVWEAEGLRLGAQRFLYRPLDSAELLDEIRTCLPPSGTP